MKELKTEEEWKAEQVRKEEEFIPSESEEDEAAKTFKITKARKEPRYMSPQEVKAERVDDKPYKAVNVDTPNSASSTEERGPKHETIEIIRKKHISIVKEDVYEAVIRKTWTSEDPDYYNKTPDGSPGVRTFLYISFETSFGEITRRMSLNYNEGSILRDLVSVTLGGYPESLTTDDLLGQHVRVMVKNVKNQRGDEWPRIVQFLPSTTQFKRADE
jgi:hypothetical protein